MMVWRVIKTEENKEIGDEEEEENEEEDKVEKIPESP